MRSTFKILFYLKRNAPKKDGTVPVYCRITLNGTISQFSCKLYINPKLWDIKTQTALGQDCVSKHINAELKKIRKSVGKHYNKIFSSIGPLTAERVKYPIAVSTETAEHFCKFSRTITKNTNNWLRQGRGN